MELTATEKEKEKARKPDSALLDIIVTQALSRNA
jgi:hypothetical protein